MSAKCLIEIGSPPGSEHAFYIDLFKTKFSRAEDWIWHVGCHWAKGFSVQVSHPHNRAVEPIWQLIGGKLNSRSNEGWGDSNACCNAETRSTVMTWQFSLLTSQSLQEVGDSPSAVPILAHQDVPKLHSTLWRLVMGWTVCRTRLR